MNTLGELYLRFRNLFHKDQLDRELHDELSNHLALHVEDNLRADMTPDEARRDAFLKLGGLEQTKESIRDASLLPWLDSLRSDATFGWRQLSQNRATSIAAVLSLSLSIGACTSAFRLIDALLLRPLPILALILRQGLLLVGSGILVGLLVSFLSVRILQSQLSVVSAFDPWTLILAPIALLSAALLTCNLPARRATCVDPIIALHYE